MNKLIGFGVLYLVTHLLSGCAANESASIPQLGSVPVGASLAKGQLQEIHLLTIDESRPTKDYVWLSGKGYAKVKGGTPVYFCNPPPPPHLYYELPVTRCPNPPPN